MNWRVEFAPDVERDVEAAARWYEVRQPGLGTRFTEEIIGVWHELAKNPLLGCRRHPTKNIHWRYPEISPIESFMKWTSPSTSSGWRRCCTPRGMSGTGGNVSVKNPA